MAYRARLKALLVYSLLHGGLLASVLLHSDVLLQHDALSSFFWIVFSLACFFFLNANLRDPGYISLSHREEAVDYDGDEEEVAPASAASLRSTPSSCPLRVASVVTFGVFDVLSRVSVALRRLCKGESLQDAADVPTPVAGSQLSARALTPSKYAAVDDDTSSVGDNYSEDGIASDDHGAREHAFSHDDDDARSIEIREDGAFDDDGDGDEEDPEFGLEDDSDSDFDGRQRSRTSSAASSDSRERRGAGGNFSNAASSRAEGTELTTISIDNGLSVAAGSKRNSRRGAGGKLVRDGHARRHAKTHPRASVNNGHAAAYDDRFHIVVAPVRKRFCNICMIYQPLRAKHCEDSGRCVATFDHYCPWLGNAVAERNRFWFYWFIVFQAIETWITIYVAMMSFQPASSVLDWFTHNVFLLFTIILLTFFTLMVTALLGYHSYLAVTNRTTWEDVSWSRITYLKNLKKHPSPFSRGPFGNLYFFCCKSLPASGAPVRWRVPRELRMQRIPKAIVRTMRMDHDQSAPGNLNNV